MFLSTVSVSVQAGNGFHFFYFIHLLPSTLGEGIGRSRGLRGVIIVIITASFFDKSGASAHFCGSLLFQLRSHSFLSPPSALHPALVTFFINPLSVHHLLMHYWHESSSTHPSIHPGNHLHCQLHVDLISFPNICHHISRPASTLPVQFLFPPLLLVFNLVGLIIWLTLCLFFLFYQRKKSFLLILPLSLHWSISLHILWVSAVSFSYFSSLVFTSVGFSFFQLFLPFTHVSICGYSISFQA